MSLRVRAIGLAVAVLSAAVAVLIAFVLWRSQRPEAEASVERAPPTLFDSSERCSPRGPAELIGRRSERRGLLLWESYPYDSRDGVLAVQRLRLAHSCYSRAGLRADAERVQRLASRFAARVESDYAASRVSLESALTSRSWSEARRELRRLIELTAHKTDHEYVRYLEGLASKVAVSVTNDR